MNFNTVTSDNPIGHFMPRRLSLICMFLCFPCVEEVPYESNNFMYFQQCQNSGEDYYFSGVPSNRMYDEKINGHIKRF